MDEALLKFIQENRNDDVLKLALRGAPTTDFDMTFALDQISGWQRAHAKLPTWSAIKDIIYPPHLPIEQCSSEATARYKAELCRRLIGGTPSPDTAFADLTGGLGVDFSFLARLFGHAYYIEQDAYLCECARNNLPLLGLGAAEVIEADCADVLEELPHLRLLFIDPARRDNHGARMYNMNECTPDLTHLLPLLLEKADFVVAKLSPMLDWHNTLVSFEDIRDGALKEIHLVAVGNECKEQIVVLSSAPSDGPIPLYCANNDSCFVTDCETERRPPRPALVDDLEEAISATWLYEPNAAIMSAGCFGTLMKNYPLKGLSANSHLYVGDQYCPDFPGRVMRIQAVSNLSKRQTRKVLEGIEQANITVRNFPMSAEVLRRRLHLEDGGDHYIFGSTVKNRKHMLFVCTKP